MNDDFRWPEELQRDADRGPSMGFGWLVGAVVLVGVFAYGLSFGVDLGRFLLCQP